MISIIAILVVLAQERAKGRLEGIVSGLQSQVTERTAVEMELRGEVATWQAYVVKLHDAMIRSGVEAPPTPQPVEIEPRTKWRRTTIQTKRR